MLTISIPYYLNEQYISAIYLCMKLNRSIMFQGVYFGHFASVAKILRKTSSLCLGKNVAIHVSLFSALMQFTFSFQIQVRQKQMVFPKVKILNSIGDVMKIKKRQKIPKKKKRFFVFAFKSGYGYRCVCAH